MSSVKKVLVVVTLLEGRNFPCCQDTSIVVDGLIDGYILSTDPVSLESSRLDLQTELAWEMERKVLQQHRLHHTPVKLQVFGVDNATCTRRQMGYVLLDLRTAMPLNRGVANWYKVLNTQGRGPSPEIFLSLCVEENIENDNLRPVTSKGVDDSLILHHSGQYYILGSLLPHMQLHVVSVTLDNPSGLPEFWSGIYYSYSLLGVDITSEKFALADFKTERASIRIMCTQEQLRKLFSSKQDIMISLCQGDHVLGKGIVSLEALLTVDVLDCKVQINTDSGFTSFIDVAVQIHKESSTFDATEYKDEFESTRTVKRSLTRSFEEASGPNLSDISLPIEQNELGHESPRVIGNTAEVKQQTGDSVSPTHSDLPVGEKVHSFANECVVGHSPVQESKANVALQNYSSINVCTKNAGELSAVENFSSTTSSDSQLLSKLNSSTNAIAPVVHAHVSTQTELSLESRAPLPYMIYFHGECEGVSNDSHQYRFSVEVQSLHNIDLEEGLKCYIKFVYPFFGLEQPIVIQPPLSLVLGGEHYFSALPSSFVFACSEVLLNNQLYCHPLLLELWTSGEDKDSLVGIAKVPLGAVLKTDKVTVSNSIHQRCSLKVPVLTSLMAQKTCAFIHCTLALEDQGPLLIQKKFSETQGPPSASEYVAAAELERWKIAQEENFTEQMKVKEASYLFQLQEEWKRREEERQKLFTQKVEAYSRLETELRNTIEAAQIEQRKLSSRETELQQLCHKLNLEEKTISNQSEAKVVQYELLYEGKLQVERAKAEELLERVEKLKNQVSELSAKLASKDAEFYGYRQQVLSKPESKLQAELTILHVEKAELEKKLSAAVEAKQQYKEWWNQAMKELAAHQKKEQELARNALQRQQQELESMRQRKIQDEDERLIFQHLSQMKEEVNRLQKGNLSDEKPHLQRKSSIDTTANPNVARWIEERDILLQTGVYTHNDFTIQELDKKINASLK